MSMGRIKDERYEQMTELFLENEDQDNEDSADTDCGGAINGGR